VLRARGVAKLCLLAACIGLHARGALPAETTPEQTLKRAAHLADDGKLADAARLYRGFLKAHPSHSQVTDARYRLAKCLDGMGWADESIAQLQEVVRPAQRTYRQRLEAFYMLGKLQASVKQYEAATKTFERMLAEGAGLYEDEVMSLCAGYYALLKRYDESAAKLNLLLRKPDSRYAEQAAYKLVLLWLHAEKPDLAITALEQLSRRFGKNKQIPGLMVRTADLCRRQQRHREAVAVCEQIRSHWPNSLEALAGSYVTGLSHRDRKDYAKAVATFEKMARAPQHRRQGLAAEALLQAADIYHFELAELPKAMRTYEEAAALARNSDSERKDRILEQCYFRLAEHHYRRREWPVALEYYLLLRRQGTELNVLGRILRCQSEMNVSQKPGSLGEGDLAVIRKKIKANPGTFAAAEGEVFLIDRKLPRGRPARRSYAKLAAEYAAVVKKYPADVLKQSHLASYIHSQIGFCLSTGKDAPAARKALAAFEKSIEVDPQTPYLTGSLESIAMLADRVGEKDKAFEAYRRLYELSAKKVRSGDADEAAKARTVEYLRGMLSRAAPGTSVARSLALVERIKKEKGIFSDAAREAQYYLGELYFVKKEFASAVKAFRLFIRIYGPKQDGSGEVVDAPWKPASVDAKTDQLYEAAARVAHAWYLQGHTRNMLEAYRWIVRNMPHRNPHVAEAQYWLSMELSKGRAARTREGRRKLAEALWKNVVNASLSFGDPKFPEGFHFWVKDRGGRCESAQRYVKCAMLKCGEIFGELGEHELAARVLEQYLELYTPKRDRRTRRIERDAMYDIARYALGREYILLNEVGKLIRLYEAYVSGSRDDRFRASGLKLLGYHAGRNERYEIATLAYATLLDEYGPRTLDEDGEAVPVPRSEWLRPHGHGWDGVRLPPPEGLDLGEVRFALGLMYWKTEDWGRCARTLAPLVADKAFRDNPSRPQALFMAGRSHYRMDDYAGGVKLIRRLVREHPRFEAAQEACVHAARGYVETKQWREVAFLHKFFAGEWPDGDWRPRMDLYAALAAVGRGDTAEGLARLESISRSETFEDVKADASYHLAVHYADAKQPDLARAAEHFEKSIRLHARDTSCLAAARLYMKLEKWDRARGLLNRVVHEFPAGDPRLKSQAKALLKQVLKHMAKTP